MSETEETPLRLIRIRDPNEALGLAIRLLAGAAPFRDMPLGLSTGALMEAIDMDAYAFASRPGEAVGFAAWRPCLAAEAEGWVFGTDRRIPPQIASAPDSAIVLAVQAQNSAVARFLHRQVRDGPLCWCPTFYYVRDYGAEAGRPLRAVRLQRPRSRRV